MRKNGVRPRAEGTIPLMSRRWYPVALLLVALAAAPVSLATSPSLNKVALRAAQVGAGYKARLAPQGNVVRGQVTLGLCGGGYSSESMRTARLQIVYTAKGKPAVSNEIVRYKGNGAVFALLELKNWAKICPRSTPVHSPTGGLAYVWQIKRLRVTHLLPGALAFQVHLSDKTMSQNVIGIYQVKGDLLSAVYEIGSSPAVAIHAAQQSAKNLRRA